MDLDVDGELLEEPVEVGSRFGDMEGFGEWKKRVACGRKKAAKCAWRSVLFWSEVTDACSYIMAATVLALMSKTCGSRARARLLRLMSGMASHEKCRDAKATVCYRLPITR